MSDQYGGGLVAETIYYHSAKGDWIPAYYARPVTQSPVPSVIVLHHMPGWDDWSKEVARKFAYNGYAAIAPHLHYRAAPGAGPDDASAATRNAGGPTDADVIADTDGAATFLRAQEYTNKKIGVIGFCSGGRHVMLVGCKLNHLDAGVDCWGGNVVVNDPSALTPARPVAVFDMLKDLCFPVLGIFGNDDANPSPEDVNKTDAELKRLGKSYDFHRYDGAGHGFCATERPGYRQAQAVDSWGKVWDFYAKYLTTGAREPALAGVR